MHISDVHANICLGLQMCGASYIVTGIKYIWLLGLGLGTGLGLGMENSIISTLFSILADVK